MATAGYGDGNGDDYTAPEKDEVAQDLLPFQLEFLRTWATSVRTELMKGDDTAKRDGTQIECIEVLPQIFGFYNIVFPLQFSDGMFQKYINFMQVQITAYSLRYPYIHTDFIDGIPLPKVWFDHSTPRDLLGNCRANSPGSRESNGATM
ncbi:hypothetical protein HD806DRAFT_523326 [Xylariaceae sp. AK1471]|nr:hypothetical protein HD806DRAFT_523326 [Xylariaceae sp. AK1471]